jgi:hypothetical protein
MRSIGLDMPLTKFDFFPALSIQLIMVMNVSAAFITRGNAIVKGT